MLERKILRTSACLELKHDAFEVIRGSKDVVRAAC